MGGPLGNGIVLMALAVLGGALIAAQGPIYTRMAGALGGPVPAALLAFGIGTLALGAGLMISGQTFPDMGQMRAVPIWAWPGGLIGVFVVLVSVLAVPRLGVSTYLVAVIAGQMMAGYLFDRWGAFGLQVREFSAANMLGLILVIAGVVLVRFK